MLAAIIDFSLRNRFIVLLGALALLVAGLAAMRQLDIDAFPDVSPVQVQINTIAPALGPEEIERRITAPIEQSLSGLPKLLSLRSISKFGLSQAIVTFDDDVDIHFARQLVNERISTVKLPDEIERPKMGPTSTGLGEVFHYVVTGRSNDPTRLRAVHDWIIRPQMRQVRGTAEINSWGGFERQYQVRLDPRKLSKFGLDFDQAVSALRDDNRSVGGGMVDRDGDTLLVRGDARARGLSDLRAVRIAVHAGVPVHIGDVAEVGIGHEVRRGAVTADGKGEVVLGLGFLTLGENAHGTTQAMKDKLAEVKENLPPDVRVEAVYDRTELVDFVIDTVRSNLFEGGLFVVAVLFVFLGNFRAAAVVALAIPLSMLFAFCGMLRFGVAASLLSLGALDFGMVVDSSVVLVENCVRRLAHAAGKDRLETIRDAALEVRKPTLFGELIILIVYLPILTLEGTEGKLYRPMALTVIFALLGSMILSMTVMPALASLFLPRQFAEREPFLARLAKWFYVPLLRLAMRQKGAVLVSALALLIVAFGMIAPNLGSDFMPKLSEGAIAIGVVRHAGTSLADSVATNTQIEKALLQAFPDEISHVWCRIGSAEVATDPMGIELTDVFISLKPRQKWRCGATTQDELTEKIEQELNQFPGLKYSFSQPIEMRVNEMESGTRSDVAIKVYGDDLTILREKGSEIEKIAHGIAGSADVAMEQITGQPVVEITLRRDEAARYGVSPRAILDLIESVGSKPIGEVAEGEFRFPLVVRLPDELRQNPEAIGAIQVPSASGERVPLARVATLKVTDGPTTITRDWGRRRVVVTCNVRGRDLGSFVTELRQRVKGELTLPPGRYSLEFGGRYEQLESARLRLLIVVPIALVLIFLLLYATYGTILDSARVFCGVPFAWVGGIFALWLRGMPFSVSAAIGFIALSGVAVLDDMILMSAVRDLLAKGRKFQEAVMEAAVMRLRPVLMTSLVASLGFVPMALSTGVGAEVQRPLATVVVGGVLSATVMSLIVLRVFLVVARIPRWR